MKKLCAIIIGFALLSVFYACQKDQLGVYNPKMKISMIYSELDGHYLQEQWIWNGDKLSRIDFFKKNGDVDHSQTYLYEGQRVIGIESDDVHSTFFYDGNTLSEIRTYSGDELLDTYVFSYDKNRLSHLSVNAQSKSTAVGDFLNRFIPGYEQLTAESIRHAEEKGISYDFSSAEIDFSWVDDDIQHMKATLFHQNAVKHLVFTYIYDECVNPKYNFLSLSVGQQLVCEDPVNLFFSKHNVKGIYVADEDAPPFSGAQSLTYSYDYYKKMPTKMYRTTINSDNNPDSVLIYSFLYQ